MKALCAIDVGNSKISIMTAKPTMKKAIEILSYKSVPNTGMKEGLIVNLEKTIECLHECLALIESEMGYKIEEAFVSISSEDMLTLSSKGIAKIEHGKVSQEDIEKALELSKVFNFSNNTELLHCIVQKYFVDGKMVYNPIDIHGLRLELDSLLVAINKQILDNLSYALNQCEIEIKDALIAPYASSLSTLSEDDRHLGVILLDIGAGLTDIAIYKDFALTHLDSIPIAGNKITSALADIFHTSIEHAEKLKCTYGCVDPDQLENPNDEIEVFYIRENNVSSISLGEFSATVSNYYRQTLEQIRDYIMNATGVVDFDQYGIVITGGSALAPGITTLVKRVFGGGAARVGHIDPRLINLSGIEINDVTCANIAGMIIYANKAHFQEDENFALTHLTNRKNSKNAAKNTKGKLNFLKKFKEEF